MSSPHAHGKGSDRGDKLPLDRQWRRRRSAITSSTLPSLAEQAKRYDEMVDAMKKVANLDVELTVEERNLLSVGYKNVIGERRASWRILSSIEQTEEARGNENHVKNIKEYPHKVETELSNICTDFIALIDEPTSSP